MKQDEAIDAIRRVRQEISARYGHDTMALIRHFQDLEKEYQDRLVPPPTSTRSPQVPPQE